MKLKIHIILFLIFYLSIFILYTFIPDIKFDIIEIYQNIFLFCIYLFFINTIIFEKEKNEMCFIQILKRILQSQLLLTFLFFVINGTLFGSKLKLNTLLIQSIHFYLTMVMVSLYLSIFNFSKNKLGYYSCLLICYLLYAVEKIYGTSIFLVPIYEPYINHNHFIPYVIWISMALLWLNQTIKRRK